MAHSHVVENCLMNENGAQHPALLDAYVHKGVEPMLVTSLDHVHAKVRESLKMPADFVVHSLRHTMLTRLGMLGVDAFTIMKIAGHSSITISQRYVHPSPESVERAFEKLEVSNQLPPRIGVGLELGIGGKNAVRQKRRKVLK
jgi:integrase